MHIYEHKSNYDPSNFNKISRRVITEHESPTSASLSVDLAIQEGYEPEYYGLFQRVSTNKPAFKKEQGWAEHSSAWGQPSEEKKEERGGDRRSKRK